MRYCDRCEVRLAERKTEELPDTVAWCYGHVCADCYGDLKREARMLGVW